MSASETSLVRDCRETSCWCDKIFRMDDNILWWLVSRL